MFPTRRAVIFGFLLLGAFLSRADETIPVLQAGGITYSNVTVFNVSATDIYFTSDHGLGNLKLKDLDPALQKHFHYNVKAAGAAEQQEAAANRQYYLQVTGQNAANTKIDSDASPFITGASHVSNPSIEPQTGKQVWALPILDQRAPDFVVEKWVTPQPNTRGKFLLIDFWATWCAPCRAIIPELNRYQREFTNNLVVIGVSNDKEEVARAFANPPIQYSLAIDPQMRMKNAINVTGIPHCLLIDPQGIVRWEGFPTLQDYPLTDKVISTIISRYSH